MKSLFLILIAAILLKIQSGALRTQTQVGSSYELVWSTISGGSVTSTGGAYEMGGMIGQFSTGALSGGNYTLAGGFLGVTSVGGSIFLPIVLR